MAHNNCTVWAQRHRTLVGGTKDNRGEWVPISDGRTEMDDLTTQMQNNIVVMGLVGAIWRAVKLTDRSKLGTVDEFGG